MTTTDAVTRGRELFARQAWGEAYACLAAADQAGALDPEDLERLATAAHLIGRDGESADLWVRAHHEFERLGDATRAARCAYRLALPLLLNGELARGGGWLSRARRLLDDGKRDCVEQGYLMIAAAIRSIFDGDAGGASATFDEAARIGKRFGDRDLMTLARQGKGRALIRMGQAGLGMSLLDEVMVAVTAGEVSPVLVGDVYCSVIDACHEIFDLRRAQEWTAALERWCASNADQLPYRGLCLVHRSEILQFHGAWEDALDEARRARECLSQPPAHRAVGAAFYQVAELHRLRGEFSKAEEAYRQASQCGREPQPGLALLRMAQGQPDAAVTAIARVLEEARDRRRRSAVLPAYVEIVLAAGDIAAARAAAAELSEIAAGLDTPFAHAAAAHALGAVLLAEGDAPAALATLRRAWTGWRELEAPYEAARARVLLGLACRAMGDEEAATMELDAARQAFQQLGAAPELDRVKQLSRRSAPRVAGGLTAREAEVLALVATGRTNRAIADELAISEKTVAHHVSNIFAKLGLSSRAAATAYAYQHDLARTPP